MIMADKIMELRKKNGWSQEELAAQLHVSRQSVSKWEGAQSVPDLNKVIAMADLFGVSTDYLLKDELGQEAILPIGGTADPIVTADAAPVRRVSMEESNTFLAITQTASRQISFGVMLCILGAACVILSAVAGAAGILPLTEDQGSILGVIILLLLVAVAVALFVKNGIQLSKYDYLEEEPIDTEYGVTGMVRERKQEYEHTHLMGMITGIVLCVLSAVPILAGSVLRDDNDLVMGIGVSLTLLLIAIGVYLIVRVSIIWEGFQKLLEEGEYSRKTKRGRNGVIAGVYWSLMTGIYLAYSFWTMDWYRSWIIWPVAGVVYAAVVKIAEAVQNR